METQTHFDLNKAMANWRADLASHESIGPDRLRELESLLNEAMAELRSKGLSSEEAFLLAKRRMGPGEVVAAEYQKEDPGGLIRTRVFWMLAGVMGMLAMAEVSRALVTVVSMLSAIAWLPEGYLLGGPCITFHLERTNN